MMKRTVLLFLLVQLSFHALAEPTSPALNKDGSVVTDVLTASYDPLAGVFPFPFNLIFLDSMDITLNPTVEDPDDPADPTVALSSLDGFSPVEAWSTTFRSFSGAPGSIATASVVPGQSVRVFQVTTLAPLAPYVVTGLVRELTPNVEYTAQIVAPGVLAIIPLRPLQEYSSFMAVLTNDITDTSGNNATPDRTYFLTKRQTPWVDANGNSTYALVPNSLAQALEPQRQITQSMEAAASAAGIPPADIILSWTVQTQSISTTLRLLQSIAQPSFTLFGSTGMNTGVIGGPGFADITIGVISLPYYLGIPSAENPIAFLTRWWKAEPGAYVPPFDQFGLDPTSTNITQANPFPELTGIQTVPLVVTTPSAATGMTKPEAGWPVVIYQHGLTRNRTDVLGLADSIAAAGYAAIAMDQPLHGAVPDVEPFTAPFWVPNTPFAPIANERTFDADIVNNETGLPPPDGLIDPSGTHSFNLLNLQVARDNIRQAETDLSVLTASIATMDIDNDGVPDFDASNIGVYGHSAGGVVTTPFMAVDPLVKRGYLNASTGVIMRTILAGAFGDRINAALAAVGLVPGTADYEQFVTVAQTVLDSGDSIHYAAEAAGDIPILFHEVIGDLTVPNLVPGSALGGSEPTIALMGLSPYSTSQANPDGLSLAGRFLPPAIHSTLIDPSAAPASTFEMQSQAASFMASQGTFVVVTNSDLMLQVPSVRRSIQREMTARGRSRTDNARQRVRTVERVDAQGRYRHD